MNFSQQLRYKAKHLQRRTPASAFPLADTRNWINEEYNPMRLRRTHIALEPLCTLLDKL